MCIKRGQTEYKSPTTSIASSTRTPTMHKCATKQTSHGCDTKRNCQVDIMLHKRTRWRSPRNARYSTAAVCRAVARRSLYGVCTRPTSCPCLHVQITQRGRKEACQKRHGVYIQGYRISNHDPRKSLQEPSIHIHLNRSSQTSQHAVTGDACGTSCVYLS